MLKDNLDFGILKKISKIIPPFDISNMMLEYVADIMEKIGKLDNYDNLNRMQEIPDKPTSKNQRYYKI